MYLGPKFYEKVLVKKKKKHSYRKPSIIHPPVPYSHVIRFSSPTQYYRKSSFSVFHTPNTININHTGKKTE